jgi:hypothetical protein
MKSYRPNDKLTVLNVMNALVDQVGPGYYQYDLYRSIHRLSKGSNNVA